MGMTTTKRRSFHRESVVVVVPVCEGFRFSCLYVPRVLSVCFDVYPCSAAFILKKLFQICKDPRQNEELSSVKTVRFSSDE